MKKISRVIAAVLCLSIFSFMAIASSSSNTSETKKITGDDKKEISSDDSTDTDDKKEASANKVTIKEQEIFNSDDVVITAKEYVTDSIWGDGIKVLIENKSDKNVMVGCDALIVNNYMITDLFGSEVAAGMNANETIYLSSNELKAAGIDTVGKVELYLHVFDSDSYDRIATSDCITIETSEVNNVEYKMNDDGYELYNDNGIRIVGKTVDENSFWGTAILLYIENTTDKNVTVTVDNMSINGFMVNPIFYNTIYSNKMAVDDITILSSDLEENGITEIDTVSLSFHISNADTYDTITDTGAIEFSAK